MNHRFYFCGVSALALVACGGSGDSVAPTPTTSAPPPPPVSTTISSTGVITGFGSIVVNGVRHETNSNTVIAVEDETETTGDDSRLRLGMRVKITAQESNGQRTATRIEYDEELKGPARSIVPDSEEPAIGTFNVVGQTVIVDTNTVFDDDIGDNDAIAGIDIRDLDPVNFPGNAPIVVEVSGFPVEDGVLATRIERVNAAAGDIGRVGIDGDELEVKGFVDSVASDGTSFVINNATFLVQGTIFEDGLAADQSLVGVFVEVKADTDSSGDLIAVRVEREDDLDDDDDDDEFEIEGILHSVDTTADPDIIVINGITIDVDDASTLANLVGNRIELEGSFDDNGVLVISDAEIEVENTIRTKDRVASINTTDGFFTTRLGLEIIPTTNSRIKDDVGADGDRLTPDEFLARLSVNDEVDARGFPSEDGVVWSRVKRDERDETYCRLRGPVDQGSINDPRFDILGITIDTTGLADGDFEDVDDDDVTRAEFFNGLRAGDIIEVKSDEAGIGCRAGELATGTDGAVSYEDDDGVAGND